MKKGGSKPAEAAERAEARVKRELAGGSLPRRWTICVESSTSCSAAKSSWRCRTKNCAESGRGLKLSPNKYLELYDFSPVGYFTFDAHGVIREVNLAGAQLLGIEKRLLANKPFFSFIADADDRNIFSNHLASALQMQGMHRCEIRLTRNDGTVAYWQLQSVAVETMRIWAFMCLPRSLMARLASILERTAKCK